MSGGTPYGPSHVANTGDSPNLTTDEYNVASETGARIATLIMQSQSNGS